MLRTNGNLWLVKTQNIQFIYFIIWVLWAVTWQKCQARKIEAVFKALFSPPRLEYFFQGYPRQDVAENAELRRRRPRGTPSLQWACRGPGRLLSPFTSSAPRTTSKTGCVLTRDVGDQSAGVHVYPVVSLPSSHVPLPPKLCDLGRSPRLSEP